MRYLLDLAGRSLQTWCEPHSDIAQKLHLLDTICGVRDHYYEFHDHKRFLEGTQVSCCLALDNVIRQESLAYILWWVVFSCGHSDYAWVDRTSPRAECHFCNLWYALLTIGIWPAILLRRSIGKWLLMELMESRNICGCTTESISWLVAWTASLSKLLLARIGLEQRSKMFWR